MAQNTPTQVADRYGKARKRRTDLWVGGTAAGLLVAAGIAFLATGGMPTGASSIEFRDIAHTIEDSGTLTSLTFEVTAPAGSEVVCEVEALNKTYAVVGVKLVELPAADERTRVITEEIRTHNLATSVTVKHCWVQPEVSTESSNS